MVLVCVKYKESEIFNKVITDIENKSNETYFKRLVFNLKFYRVGVDNIVMKVKIPLIDFFLVTLSIGFLTSLLFILVLNNFEFSYWLLIPGFTGIVNLFVYLFNTDFFWFNLLKKGLKKKGYTEELIKLDIDEMFERVLENGSK